MPVSRIPPAVRRGVRDVTPVAVGIVPFGLVTGAASVEAGLSPVQAVGLSVPPGGPGFDGALPVLRLRRRRPRRGGRRWVTEDVFATIAAGMLTLWLLRFVV